MCSSPRRSVRPTLPNSSDPPVNADRGAPVVDEVRDVVEGVPWRRDRLHAQVSGDELIPVVDVAPLKREPLAVGEEVVRAPSSGEVEPARDIVVVDVGLGHERAAEPVGREQSLDAIEVALRIDDDRGRTVVGDVAAVPELGGLDDFDVDHEAPSSSCRGPG